MRIPNTGKRKRQPIHPGEMLREDFMLDYNLNVSSLAKVLSVSRQTINEVWRERRSVSPSMALRLSRFFRNSPEFWLNAQHAVDLWQAERAHSKELSNIHPLAKA